MCGLSVGGKMSGILVWRNEESEHSNETTAQEHENRIGDFVVLRKHGTCIGIVVIKPVKQAISVLFWLSSAATQIFILWALSVDFGQKLPFHPHPASTPLLHTLSFHSPASTFFLKLRS